MALLEFFQYDLYVVLIFKGYVYKFDINLTIDEVMAETETDYNEKEKSYYKSGIKKLENRYVKIFFHLSYGLYETCYV